MKKTLLLATSLLCFIALFSSCATGKNSVTDLKSDNEKPKEVNTVYFVQMNDGSIVNYTSLKLMNAVFNDAYLLADGKTRIYPKQIKAYQNKDHYAISQNSFANGRKSYVAVEALPGFAIRIAKGKLNVYCKKFFNGSHAVDEFFLQSGDQGPILSYTPQIMSEILKENAEATSYFNSKPKMTSFLIKLQVTAALINNDPRVTKN